jgi:hypothetical protein
VRNDVHTFLGEPVECYRMDRFGDQDVHASPSAR